MGAQLTIETRYASRTNSITETTERLKCIVNAASSNASVGVETPDIEVSGGVPGVPVSASTTIKGLKAGYTSGHASKDQKYVYYDTEGPRLYLDIDYRNPHNTRIKEIFHLNNSSIIGISFLSILIASLIIRGNFFRPSHHHNRGLPVKA